MKNLMHEIVCSDIRLTELKLKRLTIRKNELLNSKPSRFHIEKLKKWKEQLDEIEKEEQAVLKELQEAYIDYEKSL